MNKRFAAVASVVLGCAAIACCAHAQEQRGTLRVGVFDIDASPPVGSPLAYDPCVEVEMPLRCKGIVLLPGDEPIVLVSVDWIGISNDGHKEFRRRIARAVGTDPKRVSVHVVHQHDAPRCDLTLERMLAAHGLNKRFFDREFLLDVMDRAAQAAAEAKRTARPVSAIGLGEGRVEKVASNRRILGPDGKVKYIRWTATKDPKIRAMPVGTIDPMLKLITFWDRNEPIVALTYYACHPQSYYRTGKANPDFPGIARATLERETGVPHVHFDGAGGNIGAGKWNDGSPENRPILAERLAEGIRRAWRSLKKHPIHVAEVGWRSLPVPLPPAAHLKAAILQDVLSDAEQSPGARFTAARGLAWLRRWKANDYVDVSCLYLGRARVLHLPGELFVEYQLAAQKMRPDLFVAVAAYGDLAMGYIGTAVAYEQGGYETSPRASLVGPDAEQRLMAAIRDLLSE